uniref:CCHC-type domain-containing protein n=1 Tax=Cajanus cajan TaxID=3821 RepID=A0A151UE43_CAJCA
MEVEQLFNYHNVSEERRVPMATLTFQGYAMYWWTSFERERRTHHEPLIQYWNELRSALKRRHIPPYFERELMDKLQRLQQRNLSVEEYRQQMELLMMRVGIRKEERTTIARFQGGLNLEIRDKVELLPYRDLNELVQLCVRVEQQLRRNPSLRKESTSYPRKDFKKEGHSSYLKDRPLEKQKEKQKGKPSNETRTSSIKCFKCLGRGHITSQCPINKTMIIRGNEILSEEITSSSSSSLNEKDEILSSSEETPCEDDLFIAQRLLTNQPNDQDQSQRENLFHSRCKIFKKTCSLIVDSGSCNNFVSQRLVDKLNLTTIAHPKSYKLQWLNEDGPIEVKDQVNVPFSIGKYKDEILCDIIPMDASHILLGRPWQHDRKAIHDGVTNKIRLIHLGNKHTLTPISPSQVLEDQVFMKSKKRKEEKKKVLELEGSVSSEEVFPRSQFLIKHSIKKCLLVEQPLYLLNTKKTLLLEKSKDDSVSSKNLVKKESHFLIQNDCKKNFLLHKDFNSFSTVATKLELKIHNLNNFEKKGSQVLNLVKKKWTSPSSTSYATTLVVPKVDSHCLFRTSSTLVVLIKHPTFGLYCLLDTSSGVLFSIFDLKGSLNFLELNLTTSLQDKIRFYDSSKLFTPSYMMYLLRLGEPEIDEITSED